MNIRLCLKSNAVDSFNESLDKYSQGESGNTKAFKFAILHLSHTLELVLKLYLQTLDESIVFTRVFSEIKKRAKVDSTDYLQAITAMQSEHYDFSTKIKGISNPHTVSLDDALSVASCEVCSQTGVKFVDQEFIDDIAWMKDLRNSIEHYEFEFAAKDVRLCMGRLIRGLDEFTDVFSLFSLSDEVTAERQDVFSTLADEYIQAVNESHLAVKEAKIQLFSGVKPKYQQLVEWNVYYCEECNNDTMIPEAESSTGYRCTYCENEESDDIQVDCDICGCPWPKGEMSAWLGDGQECCPDCSDIDSKP